jgi:DNA-binding HxlR family transcriptional regulator
MRQGKRSNCPIAFTLDLLGDRWSLLILRDMVFRGRMYFNEFLHASEGIASNVLADRLHRLQRAGLIRKEADPADRRKRRYLLTEDGLDMIPILIELTLWGSKRNPDSPIEPRHLQRMAEDRDKVVAHYRKRLGEAAAQKE